MTYAYPWYYFLAALLFAASLGYWGWWRYRRHGFSMFVMASWLIALVVGPLFAPKLLDKLQIDEEKLQWSDGFWWDEEERIIQYDTVASVRKERRMRPRIRVMIWVFQMQDGSVNEVAISSLWEKHHEEIEARFRAKGVQITGP